MSQGDEDNKKALRDALRAPSTPRVIAGDIDELGEGMAGMSMQDEERKRANEEALREAHNKLGDIEDDELGAEGGSLPPRTTWEQVQKGPEFVSYMSFLNSKNYAQVILAEPAHQRGHRYRIV